MEMVLFLEDWDKHPEYVVDLKSKNPHFMRFAQTLKSMGIKNHHWPLQLHDRDLIGINPHSTNLPQDVRNKIVAECYNNFFYALREVLIVPGSSSDNPIYFEAHRGNMFLYWCALNHVDPYIVMIRQAGKSYAMDTYLAWMFELRLAYCNGAIITKDEGLRSQNMKRLQNICNMIPAWMRGRTDKDAANSEIYKIPDRNNTIRAWIASSSEENATKICRGQTDTQQNWDEIAYLNNFQLSLPAAGAAGARARDDAKMRGDPYGMMFGTTAGRRDTRDGRFAYNLMMDACGWSESYLDLKDEAELHRVVRQGSKNESLLMFGSFLHSQIGKTDEWLREAMRASKSYGEDAEKDFGNKWLSGNLKNPLSQATVDAIAKSEVKEYFTSFSKKNFAMRHYTGQLMHDTYHKHNWGIIGLDTSDGIGRDDIGLVVTDARTGATTACGDYNNTSLFDFAEFLAEYMLENPKTILIPEARSSGRSVADFVATILMSNGINPFTRIFNTVYQDPGKFKLVYENTLQLYSVRENYGSLKRFLGFGTTGAGDYSRDNLFGRTLTSWANGCASVTHDQKLIKQFLALEVKDGRLDHKVGGHDDLVVAKLLSHWFLMNGANLHLYGLNSSQILSNVQTTEKVSDEDKYKAYRVARYKEKIEALTEIMEKEQDPYVYRSLERQVSALYSQLSSSGNTSNQSLSEFLESIRQKRDSYLK